VNLLLLSFTVSTSSYLPRNQPWRKKHIFHQQLQQSKAPEEARLDLDSCLRSDLELVGLGLAHGILHASGVRQLADIQHITDEQLDMMGTDAFDRNIICRIRTKSLKTNGNDDTTHNQPILSTSLTGAFPSEQQQQQPSQLETDFELQVISQEHDIYKGRLFTVEQCQQINRMAEYYAYSRIGTIGAGWTNELYTLTAQHLQCKNIPDLLEVTGDTFRELSGAISTLFEEKLTPGTIIEFESDGEPHLVKYQGNTNKGTILHTDNSKYVSITLNAALSNTEEYLGGGTFIQVLNQTIHLQQGEMLIHLGDLEHAGVDIHGGVRRILIGFFACQWK